MIRGPGDTSSKPLAALKDARLSRVFHTDYKYELKEFKSLKEWEQSKLELKQQILVSAGLWPLMEKMP